MKKEKKSMVKQTILTIAIALVLVFFVAYGISVFYESPQYEDYCGERTKTAFPRFSNETACLENGGRWDPNQRPCLEGVECPEGFCDADFTCRKEYDGARDLYNRDVFIASLILGLIIIVAGVLLKLESVSVGIMGGGVLLIFYGMIRYWGELGKFVRLGLLGAVLAALIWIGYKKFGDK